MTELRPRRVRPFRERRLLLLFREEEEVIMVERLVVGRHVPSSLGGTLPVVEPRKNEDEAGRPARARKTCYVSESRTSSLNLLTTILTRGARTGDYVHKPPKLVGITREAHTGEVRAIIRPQIKCSAPHGGPTLLGKAGASGR